MKAQAKTMRSQVRKVKKFVKGVDSQNDYRKILDIFEMSGSSDGL